MTTSTIHALHPQVRRILSADAAHVERAILRLDVLRQVRERRAHLARLHERHADELADAELRLAMAEAAIEEIERHEARAPA